MREGLLGTADRKRGRRQTDIQRMKGWHVQRKGKRGRDRDWETDVKREKRETKY